MCSWPGQRSLKFTRASSIWKVALVSGTLHLVMSYLGVRYLTEGDTCLWPLPIVAVQVPPHGKVHGIGALIHSNVNLELTWERNVELPLTGERNKSVSPLVGFRV